MLHSSLRPFEERPVCFCLAFVCVQATSGFSGLCGFLFVCFLFLGFFLGLFGFFFCLVWGFFCYVKEVWPEAPSDEQRVNRAEYLRKRRRTIGWPPVQCSCSQSHWSQIWAVLQETDLPNLKNVQVSQKQGTALRWLWTFAVHRFLLLVWCLVPTFCG